jgi:hypothetical protein
MPLAPPPPHGRAGVRGVCQAVGPQLHLGPAAGPLPRLAGQAGGLPLVRGQGPHQGGRAQGRAAGGDDRWRQPQSQKVGAQGGGGEGVRLAHLANLQIQLCTRDVCPVSMRLPAPRRLPHLGLEPLCHPPNQQAAGHWPTTHPPGPPAVPSLLRARPTRPGWCSRTAPSAPRWRTWSTPCSFPRTPTPPSWTRCPAGPTPAFGPASSAGTPPPRRRPRTRCFRGPTLRLATRGCGSTRASTTSPWRARLGAAGSWAWWAFPALTRLPGFPGLAGFFLQLGGAMGHGRVWVWVQRKGKLAPLLFASKILTATLNG